MVIVLQWGIQRAGLIRAISEGEDPSDQFQRELRHQPGNVVLVIQGAEARRDESGCLSEVRVAWEWQIVKGADMSDRGEAHGINPNIPLHLLSHYYYNNNSNNLFCSKTCRREYVSLPNFSHLIFIGSNKSPFNSIALQIVVSGKFRSSRLWLYQQDQQDSLARA